MLLDAMTAIGLIASSFIATNVDNLIVLVSWLLAAGGRHKQVFSGYLLGMLAILLFAGLFGFAANLFPVQSIGYLGLVPIMLGLKGLFALSRTTHGADPATDRKSLRIAPLSVAVTQLANGVDTVLVFGPLLADSELGVDLMMVGGFVTMTFAWFGLARVLKTHVARLKAVERYGHWLAPIVLILVGLYILNNTSTDVLPGE